MPPTPTLLIPSGLTGLGASSVANTAAAGFPHGRQQLSAKVGQPIHDGTKEIIVHHIREWTESYDHSVANLAVLCLDHHDKAHSKSSISRNLDGRTVTEFKQAWEATEGIILPRRRIPAPPLRDRKFVDSPLEGDGFEPSVPLFATGSFRPLPKGDADR